MSDVQKGQSGQVQDEIDLLSLIGGLWRGRWWILACVVVAIAVATVIAYRAQPQYRAQAIAAVATRDGAAGGQPLLGQFGGLAALAGINLGSGGDVEETLAVMRSREFSERFILEQNLLPGMFPRRWDKARNRWSAEGPPGMAIAYDRFNRKVRSVSQDKKTGLVSVSMVWPDPVVSARLANDYTDMLNSEMRKRAIARTIASAQFLQEELEKTSTVEVRQAISRLIESQVNQRMYANVTPEFALRVVDKALPPDLKNPIGPGKAVILALGSFVGFFAGCALVLLRELLLYLRARLPGS